MTDSFSPALLAFARRAVLLSALERLADFPDEDFRAAAESADDPEVRGLLLEFAAEAFSFPEGSAETLQDSTEASRSSSSF